MSSFEPGSSAATDGCRRSHSPQAEPTRIAMNDAMKATVELMDFPRAVSAEGQDYSSVTGSQTTVFPGKSSTPCDFCGFPRSSDRPQCSLHKLASTRAAGSSGPCPADPCCALP